MITPRAVKCTRCPNTGYFHMMFEDIKLCPLKRICRECYEAHNKHISNKNRAYRQQQKGVAA